MGYGLLNIFGGWDLNVRTLPTRSEKQIGELGTNIGVIVIFYEQTGGTIADFVSALGNGTTWTFFQSKRTKV